MCDKTSRKETFRELPYFGVKFVPYHRQFNKSLERNELDKRCSEFVHGTTIFRSLDNMLSFIFVAKENVMSRRKDGCKTDPAKLGLTDQVLLDAVRIFGNLSPKMQQVLFDAKRFKEHHHFQFCWTKGSVVYLTLLFSRSRMLLPYKDWPRGNLKSN